ncbi:MAG: tRNA (adenosine(37)-N6)-threonylcarbamoyltransferase complex dimerization subunit type 1 TsaB [Balneola sp.]|nr:MAG: tRNA (adenosine(37)-N6)-threonylcarbamoyltransferase complex dimerization subunit type 1 TsaB [Balneola sp.]
MILAYETSTNVCSVSFQDRTGRIYERRTQGRGVHSDNVFLFTQGFMEEHNFTMEEVDVVLVSNGPGSYTGLRIGASAIKGLLFGLDVPLFACDTLASFAISPEGTEGHTIHGIIDARRIHVYHQAFDLEKGRLISRGEAKVIELLEFEKNISSDDVIVGTGTLRLTEGLIDESQIYDERSVSANSLLKLYQLPNFKKYCKKVTPEALDPNYVTSSQVNNSDQ